MKSLPVPVETKPDKDDDTEGPFPMYRDEDVTRVHPNVFIHRSDYGYQVVLQAGVQYFDVGPRDDDEKHALFIANMLAKAVGKLAKPEETAVQEQTAATHDCDSSIHPACGLFSPAKRP